MDYETVVEESYMGYDISVYTHKDAKCSVDLKYPCGELIRGWTKVPGFKMALNMAKHHANKKGEYKKDHCEDEWCKI